MPILDLLFPRRCLGCGRWGNYFCDTCVKIIEPLKKQICPVCWRPAISGKTHLTCHTSQAIDGLTSFFAYRNPIKTAITKLKYKLVTDLALELVTLIHRCIRVEKQDYQLLKKSRKLVLVPVPLHPRRERERGFNQAELLGKLLAEKFGWQFQSDLLKRVKATKPQVKLKGKERLANVKGVFEISPNILISQYPSILIFDDVWTTGSTLRECGRVLKKAKAKKVWGLTLAR